MEVRKVGVVGCGLMGSGIAHVCAAAGFTTTVREVDNELLDKGMERIFRFIEKAIAKEKTTEAELDAVRANLSGTTRLEDLGDCDLIVEAVTENPELKSGLFAELDRLADPGAIFASNTSSLKITDIAAATGRADRFVGMHFFNPVPMMELVEVVRTDAVNEEIFDTALRFVEKIGKTAVACSDTTGFVVNRLLVPYLLDAIRGYEAGIASVPDIDNAMMLGCGYPMGPLALLDFVGLDTTLHIAGIMTREFGLPQYRAPKLLQKMVEKGLFGKKSGRGFYVYASGERLPNDEELRTLLR